MKKILFLLFITIALPFFSTAGNAIGIHQQSIASIEALLNRIGGEGTAQRFDIKLNPKLNLKGKDIFILSQRHQKPAITGSSLSAITTGINWYLNHYAHVNLSWNQLTRDLSKINFPLPTTPEVHECSVDYRYYLNYCTFSYSMSVWTWERWEKEIDWMALHGINMPLQIVGLDVVWKKLLMYDLDYTFDEVNQFIAGPCFQAWWGMNNLEGWGGPNREWWYKRQEELARKIVSRQKELGMQPVLPGYSGMVPSNITEKGYGANNQGNWCTFVRPYILDPNSTAFKEIAQKYYKRLEEVMGISTYYSMDPFHEGANTTGIDVPSAYARIAEAMKAANPNSKWVIQYWQWGKPQYHVLKEVTKGDLIILDLFSDAHTHFDEYEGHESIYCILPNFGGRTGLFGRLTKFMQDFYIQQQKHPHIKGVGTTPEAIEQCPVLYDALYEMPWYDKAPEAGDWLENYTIARYGVKNKNAQQAWEKIRLSALHCPTSLQGPHEAVICARPALSVDRVSTWGGTDIYYNPQDVIDAAFQIYQAGEYIHGENYNYDLADFTRQALTDYAYYLLKGIEQAYQEKAYTYKVRQKAFLQLILDLDKLLCTNSNLMVGNWIELARRIADESNETSPEDKDWLEFTNARTLITTWGEREASETGGLRDYSYRTWGGMLKDYYYKRWEAFFNCLDSQLPQPIWFDMDWKWAHNKTLKYDNRAKGNTCEVVKELLHAYFIQLQNDSNQTIYIYRHLQTILDKPINLIMNKSKQITLPIKSLPADLQTKFAIDLNHDGIFSETETSNNLHFNIQDTNTSADFSAILKFSDHTEIYMTLRIQ